MNATVGVLHPIHCTKERKVKVEVDMTTIPAFVIVLILLYAVLRPRAPKPKINWCLKSNTKFPYKFFWSLSEKVEFITLMYLTWARIVSLQQIATVEFSTAREEIKWLILRQDKNACVGSTVGPLKTTTSLSQSWNIKHKQRVERK